MARYKHKRSTFGFKNSPVKNSWVKKYEELLIKVTDSFMFKTLGYVLILCYSFLFGVYVGTYFLDAYASDVMTTLSGLMQSFDELSEQKKILQIEHDSMIKDQEEVVAMLSEFEKKVKCKK